MEIMSLSPEEIIQNKEKIKICVIGLGRIGLPLATVLSDVGYRILGLDINEKVVQAVNAAQCHVKNEPGLQDLLQKVVEAKNLTATTDNSIIVESDVVIICVPTPVNQANHPNYSFVENTCETISQKIKKGSLILVESTVGPGIVEDLIIPILEKSGLKAGKDFGIAATPERANPGSVLKNLREDYKIVGGIDNKSTELTVAFYSLVNKKIVKVSNPKTANSVKLTENIYRNTNIALMNELAVLYEKLGIDMFEVIKACSTKWNFLPHYPGPGVGGPCLPVNPYYLIDEAIKVNYVPHLIRLANEVNSRMPERVIEHISEILNHIGKTISGSQIAILGVGYKSNIGDTQLTPAEPIISKLRKLGARVKIYDLFANGKFLDIDVEKIIDNTIKNSDCLVFITDHDEFKTIDFKKLKTFVNEPCAIVDCRGLFDPQEVHNAGFSYIGVGRLKSSK